jgi:hypothetical protein
MSKKLAELLYEPEILVESAIKKLEHLSGFESTDVRLLVEINNKTRTKLADIGLDPDDTTGPELYHALLAKVENDEQTLNQNFGQIIRQITDAHKDYSVYALKQSVAKELLRNHPPRKLMKELSYRSVESMLKRENICTLFAFITAVESPRWLNVFWKDLAKITPSDFEVREISVISLTPKYATLTSGNSETISVPLMGAVMVNSNSGSKIALSLSIANSIGSLRSISAYIKLKNVESNFGKNLSDVIKDGLRDPLQVSRLPVSWRTIFHHYGQRDAREHTEFFGPHILHEDILAHNSIKTLSKISPIFTWWQDLEYVAKKTEQGIVSLNLIDVIKNAGLKFEERSLDHFRKSLWHEFIDRYLMHPSVEQHFMQQLEPQTIPIADIPMQANPENEIRQMMEVGV